MSIQFSQLDETETKQTARPIIAAGSFDAIMCVVQVIAIAVLTIALSINPLPALDLFWQLPVGHDIVTHLRPPTVDTFSWTRLGAPWNPNEWLMFAAFWEAFHFGHFAGVWLLEASLLVVSALSVFIGLRSRVKDSQLAFILTAMIIFVSSAYFQPRPQIVTCALLPITLGIFLTMRDRTQTKRWMFATAAICAAWCNLHQGVVVVVGLFATIGTGDVIQSAVGRKRAASVDAAALKQRGVRTLTLAAFCLVAVLISPYGYHLFTDTWRTLSNQPVMLVDAEWHPFTGQSEKSMMLFPVLCVVVLASWIATTERRHLGDGLAVLFLAIQAFAHLRNVPIFALAAPIISAPHIASAWRRLTERWSAEFNLRASVGVSTFGMIVACVNWHWAMTQQPITDSLAPGIERIGRACVGIDTMPEAACAFMEKNNFPTNLRMFNDYGLGGYLISRMPEQKVFIDGRLDVYAGSVLDDYTRISWAQQYDEARPVIEKYGLNCVVTRMPHHAQLISQSPTWALVYADRTPDMNGGPDTHTWIFLRNTPEFADLAIRCRLQNPDLATDALLSKPPPPQD